MHNDRMNDKELTVLVKNEIEWRKKLWKKLEIMETAQAKTKEDMAGLKVKVTLFGGLFGALGGTLITYFTGKH